MLRQFLKEYKLFLIAVVQLANGQVGGKAPVDRERIPSFRCKRLGFLCTSSSPFKGADHWTFDEGGGGVGDLVWVRILFLKPLVFFSV